MASDVDVRYDAETDILYIRLNERPIAESERLGDGVIVDYDAAGAVVGIEVLWMGMIMQEAGDADS